MIYLSSFVFTLLLAHTARAVPACGDVAPSRVTYGDTAQTVFAPIEYKVTWDNVYDNPNGKTKEVACENLDKKYPIFKDFPNFPHIGGAFDITFDNSNCRKCWNLTDTKTKKHIYLTAIDGDKVGFNIAKEAFIALGGNPDAGTLEATAFPVTADHCGFH
jgi:hypothetical protein